MRLPCSLQSNLRSTVFMIYRIFSQTGLHPGAQVREPQEYRGQQHPRGGRAAPKLVGPTPPSTILSSSSSASASPAGWALLGAL